MSRKKKMPEGGDVRAFYNSYLHSPNYLKRLKDMGYVDPQGIAKYRSQKVSSTFPSFGQKNSFQNGVLNINPNEVKELHSSLPTVMAHEYSHVAGANSLGDNAIFNLNDKELQLLNTRNKYLDIDTGFGSKLPINERISIDHNKLPGEAKADIDALRYRLKKDGIYDTGTQDFNQDFLNKAKEKYKNDGILNRNFKRYSDKDLINIMNKVAVNQSQDSNTAKNGISMAKKNVHPLLEEILHPFDEKAKSGIHIKPENRGKFTAYKKRTGKTTEEALHSKDPHVRKMANFARNAAKWHHADDGDEITMPKPYVQRNAGVDNNTDLSRLEKIDNYEKLPSDEQQYVNDITTRRLPQKRTPWGDIALGALTAVDAFLPYGRINRNQVVQPPQAYNQHPYGTGSQALMEDGGEIYNPPFNNFMQRQVLEDKDGRANHNYGPKDNYYAEGGIVQYGGYRPSPTTKQYGKDSASNRLVLDLGGDIEANKLVLDLGGDVAANKLVLDLGGDMEANKLVLKYGYRLHQDPTRNRPTFDDGGYIDRLTEKGKVIPNIMDWGGEMIQGKGITKGQAASDRPYEGAVYYKADLFPPAEVGAAISKSQRRTDRPYDQLWYDGGGEIRGGAIPWTRTVMGDNKFEVGGRMIADGLGGKGRTASSFKFLDEPDEHTLFTAEYRTGGPISPQKAREILHDGTAHGHKLTDKQRRYFGAMSNMKYGGHFDSDLHPLSPKDKPMIAGKKRPIMPTGGELGPGKGGFTAKNMIASKTSGVDDAHFIDHLNYALSTGKAFKGFDTSKYSADQKALLQGAYVWRGQNQGKASEDVIQSYFNRPITEGNSVDALRQRLGKIGYGPTAMYKSTPNIQIQALQGQSGPDTSNLVRPDIASLEDGGGIESNRIIDGPFKFHYGGDMEPISINPYSGPTYEFKGPSHEDGGIGMSYGGKKVEVEGQETGFVDKEGDFNVMGNMVFPGTNKKFKSLSKDIAKQENGANKKFKKGQELLTDADPNDSYDYLRYNSGRALTIGADMRMKKLTAAKEKLADIQNTILDVADNLQIDPQELAKGTYKKAKYGAKVKGASGLSLGNGDEKPTRSDRNHNPGNIKFGKWAKDHGATGQDKDGFAIFPDDNVGTGAMKNLLKSSGYKNLTVEGAINKWTAGAPYAYDLPTKGKKVSDLSEDEFNTVINTMRKGEGTRYGSLAPTKPASPTPGVTIPNIVTGAGKLKYDPSTITPDRFHSDYTQVDSDNQPLPDITLNDKRIPSSARFNKLNPTQFAGEAYALATNREVPVYAQKYQPTLYQPYQVSFQDRLDENERTFNEIAKMNNYNPTVLAALGANKYAADNQVKGEEFRTNQAISEDITNKNIGILNDAQLKNLQLADQQMVRQATARSKTKAQTQEALNSISSKILQNNLENLRLKTYEPLFDYRYEDLDNNGSIDQMGYEGAPASFDFSGRGAGTRRGGDNRMKYIYDKNGNIKETQETDLPSIDDATKALRYRQLQRKVYLPPR